MGEADTRDRWENMNKCLRKGTHGKINKYWNS